MSAPETANLLVEVADLIARVQINRPDKRNALDTATRADLMAVLDWSSSSDEVRVVVISGSGGMSFASGADLTEAADDPTSTRATLFERRIYDAVAECARPVVAMVDGFCLGGGCELAMSADIRVASMRSKFGQPEIRLGIIPGGGATQRLPRLVGIGQAMRLILTGEIIGAAEAHALGLVDILVATEDLHQRTLELCSAIARSSPIALGLAKQAVRASFERGLGEGVALERDLLCRALATEDATEGIAAFREKRAPEFRGR